MKGLKRLVFVCALFLMVQNAHTAGFQLIEQGVSGLGNAYAGGAASAEDASTIFFNPASMTRLPSQFIFGLHLISPSAKFKNDGSKTVLGSALKGGDGGDGGENALIPNLYYLRRLGDSYAFGLGVNVPFGLATKYPKDWVGRYHAVESDFKTLNINPSLAYKVTDSFSIGGGINIQYAEATLSNMVDLGTAGFLAGALPVTASQNFDAFAELKGDAWALGWNLGILFEPTRDTRIGLSFRSKTNFKLEGDVKYDVPLAVKPLATANKMVNGDVTANITLPAIASVSVYHRDSEKLALMADISSTGWSDFRELRIKFKSGQSDSVTTENWRNTLRTSVGASYYADEKNTFRFGIAYDRTPVPDPQHRTPRIPDGDRTWVAAGYGYKYSQKLSFDLGAAYLFVLNDPKIDKTATGEDTLRGALKGTYDCNVKILSASVNYTF